MWSVFYDERVVKKDIPALGTADKKRIREAIEKKLQQEPFHFGKPLSYSLYGVRSLRVGHYRVLYSLELEKKEVLILAIGHRSEIYEDK